MSEQEKFLQSLRSDIGRLRGIINHLERTVEEYVLVTPPNENCGTFVPQNEPNTLDSLPLFVHTMSEHT